MRYRAFFSYSRVDDRVANWLHTQLDQYRTPRTLVGLDGELGPVPAKLHPIFRDRTDLEAGGHIDTVLQEALEASETLVVLCTPTSAKSHWVNHECETFLNLGREARIFPVIAAGVPDSEDLSTECFPPALRGKGLLAADLRQIKLSGGQVVGDGKTWGALKLIAGLLGLKLDDLAQRERRRDRDQRRLLSIVAGVFLAVAVAAGVAFVFADRNAEAARSTLHQFYAAQAWDEFEQKDYLQAARYALAGMQLAPENVEMYRTVLGAVMFEVQWAGRLGDSSTAAQFPGGRDGPAEMAAEVETVWRQAMLEHRDLPRTYPPSRIVSRGGRFIASIIDDRAALWDVSNAALIARLQHSDQDVNAAAFSDDETRIVTVGGDNLVRIWDTRSGDEVMVLRGHSSFVQSAMFSHNASRVVTAGWDGYSIVWDVRSGRRISAVDFGRYVESAVISPDGARVVALPHGNTYAGVSDRVAHLWNASTGAEVAVLQGHESAIADVAFSPDSQFIATTSADRTVRVWSARTGAHLATLHAYAFEARFSPDGSHLLTSGENAIRIWDSSLWTRTNERGLVRTIETDRGRVLAVGVSNGAARFFTASDRSWAMIWDGARGERLAQLQGPQNWVNDVEFSPDGSRLITNGSWGADTTLWNAGNGALVTSLEVTELGERLPGPFQARFSPDGTQVWAPAEVAGVSRTLAWNSRSGERVDTRAIERGFWQGTYRSSNGTSGARFEIVTGLDGRPKVLDAVTGQLIGVLDVEFAGRYGIIERSPDGMRALIAGTTGPATLWDVRDGRLLLTMQSGTAPVDLARFSPDAETVVTSDTNGVVRIWGVGALTRSWSELARAACRDLLAPEERSFYGEEVQTNELLRWTWREGRDVCEGYAATRSP